MYNKIYPLIYGYYKALRYGLSMEMLLDDSIKNLINAAYFQKNDIFIKLQHARLSDFCFDDVCTAVFLPSSFSGPADSAFADFSVAMPYYPSIGDESVILCDIRFIAEDFFRELLIERGVKRFIIPFAECALKGEYLYRGAYSWIGEFRAMCPYYVQVLALFPPCDICLDKFVGIFGCKDVICAGKNITPSLKIFETSSAQSKFYYTASEAEKYAFKKTVIYFNSRNEAEAFCGFLRKRKTAYIRFDGSLSREEKAEALRCFDDGVIPIVVATRSFVRETVFAQTDRCIFAGIPFSFAHLLRCCNRNIECTVIYCRSDYERNEKISRSLADVAGEGEIYTERMKRLSEIYLFLQKE